nr:polyamine-modulated factor 1 [Quercus suber]
MPPQEDQEAPPSPMPSPPIASAPGPRAVALQNLYTSAISHILKTCSYTNFSACFPTPAQAVPTSMQLLHEQFIAKLGENFHREFANILEDRNVVPNLNELDRLVEEAKKRKERAVIQASEGSQAVVPVPPHTLPPASLYLSHLAPTLTQHSNTIAAEQSDVENENVELFARVMQQRKDISSLMQGLENVVADLNASVAALTEQPADMEALREECRDADDELRMER